MRSCKRGDHAAHGADLLLGKFGARKQIAHIAHHAGLFFGGFVESGGVELGLEMFEEAVKLLLGGKARIGRLQAGAIKRCQFRRLLP